MSDKYLCIKKSSENFLKTVKIECVWIITLSFNDNRKFLMNKNVCLNVLEAVEIDECQLNLFISVIKISISFSAFVSKGNEPDCLLH